jgi:[ribosomal protein S18]-alanine N-acetyltransferase
VTPSKARRIAFKLRRGRRSDLDTIAALEREIFASHFFAGHIISRANFRRLLASPSATFILAQPDLIQAGAQRQLAGYVLVLYRADSDAARMYSIGVAAPFRRRGLAGMLVRAAEKDAVARSRKAMRLEVRSDERGIIALYESFGYQRVGGVPGYYGGRVDALRLEKTLGKEPRQRS